MQKNLISVIVPIYNVEKYLDRCLKSLMKQTYSNIEIILVDDGSPDQCPQMCDAYALQDKRIKVVHKENQGLGFARNSGLEVAEGEYVAFVDSDDYVTEDMCEKLFQAAKKNDADVVYGGIVYENTESGEKRMSSAFSEEIVWKNEQVDEFFYDMIACKPEAAKDTIMEVSVWKALFKKSVFDDYQIRFVSEREFISEDVIFNIDYLSKCNCVVAIPDCIYYYCVNPVSLSKVFRTDRFEKVLVLYHEMERRIMEIGKYSEDEVKLRLGRFLIARARTNAKQIILHDSVLDKDEIRVGIGKIIYADELQKVWDTYPMRKLPIKYRILALSMKKRLIFPLFVLFKMKQ